MKLNKLIIASLALGSFSVANAAVTIAFNNPFNGGLSSNLANTAGVVTNGLKWGILVDTVGNNGILQSYDLITFTSGTSTTLQVGGVSTGDRLILATTLTADSSQGGQALESDFTTPGGNGGVEGIAFDLSNGVAAGQNYWIVWIDETTKKAGALTNAAFVVPPDGATVNHDSAFLGADPIRPATNISFIPEPSSMLLGLLGALGLIRRRR